MKKINRKSLHKDTLAFFVECITPTTEPSYISADGDKYWYGEDENGKYVIRYAKVWGIVGTCCWFFVPTIMPNGYLLIDYCQTFGDNNKAGKVYYEHIIPGLKDSEYPRAYRFNAQKTITIPTHALSLKYFSNNIYILMIDIWFRFYKYVNVKYFTPTFRTLVYKKHDINANNHTTFHNLCSMGLTKYGTYMVCIGHLYGIKDNLLIVNNDGVNAKLRNKRMPIIVTEIDLNDM